MTWIWLEFDLDMTWTRTFYLKLISFTQFYNCGKFYIIESKYNNFLGTNRLYTDIKIFNPYPIENFASKITIFSETNSTSRFLKIFGTEIRFGNVPKWYAFLAEFWKILFREEYFNYRIDFQKSLSFFDFHFSGFSSGKFSHGIRSPWKFNFTINPKLVI